MSTGKKEWEVKGGAGQMIDLGTYQAESPQEAVVEMFANVGEPRASVDGDVVRLPPGSQLGGNTYLVISGEEEVYVNVEV